MRNNRGIGEYLVFSSHAHQETGWRLTVLCGLLIDEQCYEERLLPSIKNRSHSGYSCRILTAGYSAPKKPRQDDVLCQTETTAM
jgi:hypothetical protein